MTFVRKQLGAGNKQHAKRVIFDGIEFDSRDEKLYYEKVLLPDRGDIYDLETHKEINLVYGEYELFNILPDFWYRRRSLDGRICIDDWKGVCQGAEWASWLKSAKVFHAASRDLLGEEVAIRVIRRLRKRKGQPTRLTRGWEPLGPFETKYIKCEKRITK